MNRLCTKTCKGRVVYNRKPHGFKLSDVHRIVSRIRPEIFKLYVALDDWSALVSGIISIKSKIAEFSFGGGGFGGGGATRDFSRTFNFTDFISMEEEMKSADVIILWKEKEN